MAETIRYIASPTLRRFHRSEAPFRMVLGPIGSGKSVASCTELLRRGYQQLPDVYGRRRSRFAVVRNTYRQLESTTIPTWQQWVPGKITYSSPIRHVLEKKLPDGTWVDMETLFMPLDKPGDVGNMLSLELTGAWLNEVREIPRSLTMDLKSRIGRWPMARDAVDPERVSAWNGMIMDSNYPDEDTWIHELDMDPPPGWEFFRQPGAMTRKRLDDGTWVYTPNPLAENVMNIPKKWDYYWNAISGSSAEWCKVYVCGEYGSVFNGRPVYEEDFSDRIHVSETPLEIFKGLPIWAGFDFGLTPSCVVAQLNPSGQLRILREYIGEHVGITQLVNEQVRPGILKDFQPGVKFHGTGDPAGVAGSEVSVEQSAIGALCQMGFPTRPARTNAPVPRINGVQQWLHRLGAKGQPAFIIDPSCKVLIKGFKGGYMYERVAAASSIKERYKAVPAKNEFSHVHDALQYLVQGVLQWNGEMPDGTASVGTAVPIDTAWLAVV